MSQAAVTATPTILPDAQAPQASQASKWVVDARWDSIASLSTLWFPLVVFLSWRGLSGLGLPGAEITLAVFTAAISLPHFLTTFTFTYMDVDQRAYYRQHKLAFVVLPVLILVGSWLYSAMVGPLLLTTALVLYGEHHIAAQNIGFAALYRQRNQEGPLDRRIDHLVFNSAWITSVFLYGTHAPGTAGLTFFGRSAYSLPLENRDFLLTLLLLFAVGAFLAFVGRQVQRWWLGLPVSLPKLLFMVTTWPTFLVLPFVISDAAVVIILRNGYHSIQYLALVYLLNSRRVAARPERTSGVLETMVRRGPWFYLGLHLAVGIAVWFLSDVYSQQAGWGNDMHLRYAFYPGLILCHYFMDGLTWRFEEPHARRTVLAFLRPQAPPPPGGPHGDR
jgi:hypothetical protein